MGYKYTDNKKLGEFSCTERAEIKKHSPNIIDLIEVGDYVNHCEVVTICSYDEDGNDNEELGIGMIDSEDGFYVPLTKIQIKSIVTHEQFNSIKYEVE